MTQTDHLRILSGYRILALISISDGKFSAEEGILLLRYMSEEHSDPQQILAETENLLSLPKDEMYSAFFHALETYYTHSSEDQRIKFLNNAVKMVVADKQISPEENDLLKEIFNAWDADHEF